MATNSGVLTSIAAFLRAHPPTLDEPVSIVALDNSIVGQYWEVRKGSNSMTFTESFVDVVADLTVVAALARRVL